MMAELLGKETGVCRGRGGSMHMADLTLGSLGANGVVGGGLPLSVGAGLALKLRQEDQVVRLLLRRRRFQRGQLPREPQHGGGLEAAGGLPLREQPVRHVDAGASRDERGHASPTAPSPTASPARQVDGMDVLAVREAVREAAAHARAGKGPVLIEALTYRYLGHSKSDKQLYRTKEEVEEWKKKDAIKRFERYLDRDGRADPGRGRGAPGAGREDHRRSHRVRRCRPRAVGGASDRRRLPRRAGGAGRAGHGCRRPGQRQTFGPNTPINPPAGTREITYSEALREAMAQALASDPKVFLLGEDIGVYGGAFGVTKDLIEEFGPDRVRDTPISENAIVGAAVGSAVTGMRPIAEMQFMDFITLGMEQTVLQGAKIRYMFGGKASVPMVLRLPAGSGTGAAAQHSESLESWFLNVPGLKVVAPATPYDAKGMLLAAIADNNPVMFVENKLLYKSKGPVPDDPYIVPLGQAAVRREGEYYRRRHVHHGAPRASKRRRSWPRRGRSSWK